MNVGAIHDLIFGVVPPLWIRITPMYLAGALIAIGLLGELVMVRRDTRRR